MTVRTGARLYQDSTPIHDWRYPDKWQNKPAEGWTESQGVVSGVTNTEGSPLRVTVTGHGATTGMNARFSDVAGDLGAKLNGKTFVVTVVDANTIDLSYWSIDPDSQPVKNALSEVDTDGGDYPDWTSGGVVDFNDYDSEWEIAPPTPQGGIGQMIIMNTIELMISNNADLHSPLAVSYYKKDGSLMRRTVYYSLDDFLGKFTKFEEIAPARYNNPIEIHTYEFGEIIVLRTADTPAGAFIPYMGSLTLRVLDHQPYDAINKDTQQEEALEYCESRFTDATWYLDPEYSE